MEDDVRPPIAPKREQLVHDRYDLPVITNYRHGQVRSGMCHVVTRVMCTDTYVVDISF